MRRFKTRIHNEDLLGLRNQNRRRVLTRSEAYRVKNELRQLACH
jgi:hypothetical protein